MPLSSPPLFDHVRAMMSIILGLAVTTLLTGMFEFRDQRKGQPPLLHIGWSVVVVIESVVFWWWEFRLRDIAVWSFGSYAFVLAYSMLFYVLARILYPQDIAMCDDHDAYFLRNRRWFFGLCLLSIVADVWDGHIKGPDYIQSLGMRYYVHNGFGVLVAIVGLASANRVVQWVLLVSTLAYEVGYVAVMYRHV